MTTVVVNMNTHPVSVLISTQTGKPDYVSLAPRGRVTLPPNTQVDQNWLQGQPKIKIVTNDQVEGE